MRETESTPLIPELADLRGAARERAILAEARVVLAGRLGVQPEEALQHLIWLARDLDVGLEEAAAMVTGVRGGRTLPPEEPESAAGAHAAVTPPRVVPSIEAFPVPEADVAEDARRLAELPDDPEAKAVLDASIDSAAHLVPVRDGGKVLDFLYANLNTATRDLFGRGAEELAGQRLLRMDPGSALLGLFARYVEVLETGRPYERGPFEFSTAQEGETRTSRMAVKCVAVPTGVCVTWHYLDDEDRLRRRLERAGRLAALGFAEYDLATDRLQWTPQMAANYGLRPGSAPMLDELSKVVMDEDRPLTEERFQTMLSRQEPVEMEHRVVTPAGEQRHLWVFAEPVLDSAGRPVSVNLLSQDITRRRGIEQALAETRREILRQQARAAQERRVAVTLRRAILPAPEELPQPEGLRLAVRTLVAGSAERVGGDWFACKPLPDGRTLLAIGDAAGHGLPAAAAMARTRNALLGLAYTGQVPGRLVGWLNEMVGELEEERAATGTALVARYDPADRIMEWASAGHLPPILLRNGAASQLRVRPDPMLGALPAWEYATVSSRLEPGDLVVLYTDGLVERRDADLEERLDRLTELVGECGDDPQEVLETVLDRMRHDPSADDTTVFVVRVDSF
ncbi:PP2C family protein-serine/threonine phosphatase [Actinomadura sp. 21ATH]|uniref:PP2C family protein-serine/threonine phosphatase n=1 Tax=Actinomadura sp. 21ATH TaxID=1735444 RepID=UPI0035C25621